MSLYRFGVAMSLLILGCLSSAQQSASDYIDRYAATRDQAKSAIAEMTDGFKIGPAFPNFMPVEHQKSVANNYREYIWAFSGLKLYEKEVRDIQDARPPGPVQLVSIFDGKEEYMHYGPLDAASRYEYSQASVGDKHLRGAPNLFSLFRKVEGRDLLEVLRSGSFRVEDIVSQNDNIIVALYGRMQDGRTLQVQLASEAGFLPKRIRLFLKVFGKDAILQAETASYYRKDDVVLPASGSLKLVSPDGALIWKRELTAVSYSKVNEVPDALFLHEFPPGTGVTYPNGGFEKVPYPRRIGTAVFILSGAALLFVLGLLIKRLAQQRSQR